MLGGILLRGRNFHSVSGNTQPLWIGASVLIH